MMPVAMTQGSSLERSPLGDLYVRHAPESIRLAFLLTGDRALAEDLVQEAFARLVGRLRHLRDPSAFGAYLRRTIVNLATSHFRRRHQTWIVGTSRTRTSLFCRPIRMASTETMMASDVRREPGGLCGSPDRIHPCRLLPRRDHAEPGE
jgi:RNA polymerase sigma factor (sigma-70 family)